MSYHFPVLPVVDVGALFLIGLMHVDSFVPVGTGDQMQIHIAAHEAQATVASQPSAVGLGDVIRPRQLRSKYRHPRNDPQPEAAREVL